MRVKVKYFALLRELAGKREEDVEVDEETRVEELLEKLSERYGERFRDYVYGVGEFNGLTLTFLLNGRNIELMDGFKTKLRDGDTLSILPPVVGG